MGSSLQYFPFMVYHQLGSPLKVKVMKQYKDTPYEIDQLGNIYRQGKTKPLKPDTTNKGYHRATLCINGITQRIAVHRIVAETYIPNPHNKPHINHIDNNPLNNTVVNLEWCDHSENMLHCHKQGRCSNLLATKAASDKKFEESTEHFKQLLGTNFIKLENRNPRNYVHYLCQECGKALESRTDSPVFKRERITCRYCK